VHLQPWGRATKRVSVLRPGFVALRRLNPSFSGMRHMNDDEYTKPSRQNRKQRRSWKRKPAQ